jgi:hypothetical protein
MKCWIATILALSTLGIKSAAADLQTAKLAVPDAELVGEARLKVLFWNVLDASLYAPDGTWSPDEPFVLSVSYLRNLRSERIVGRLISEMRRQGVEDDAKLARWSKARSAIFSDVDYGTTVTGVVDDERHAVFYRNGEPIGTVRDPEFSKYFFDVLLGDEASRPELRARLLDETS